MSRTERHNSSFVPRAVEYRTSVKFYCNIQCNIGNLQFKIDLEVHRTFLPKVVCLIKLYITASTIQNAPYSVLSACFTHLKAMLKSHAVNVRSQIKRELKILKSSQAWQNVCIVNRREGLETH